MINLLTETMDVMMKNHLKVEDIVFIGILEPAETSYIGKKTRNSRACTWEQFKKLANKVYENDFGSVKVVSDLTICFKDGTRLVRKGHDNFEWWDVIKPFKKPEITYLLTSLFYTDEEVFSKTSDLP